MATTLETATELQELLGTRAAAVAIAFVEAPPAGVARREGPAPASCSYWREAADGAVFYTDASDHQGCPVGAHTHGVQLSADKAKELMGLIETMVGLSYLKAEEVPQIPRRAKPLEVAVYAPLAVAPVPPDLVLVRGNARQLMLVAEAAKMAGLAGSAPAMGRPTCAVLPLAESTQRTAASFGCIGNRVYTGLPDDEGYVAIPGAAVEALVAQLRSVVRANAELEKFHRARAGA